MIYSAQEKMTVDKVGLRHLTEQKDDTVEEVYRHKLTQCSAKNLSQRDVMEKGMLTKHL